jgi:type I restriction enzyme S subunit
LAHLKKEGIDFESAYLISEFDYVEANKRSKVDTLDILLSMIGTVGLLYFVMEREINFAIKNIGLFKSSKNQDYSEFIFLFLTSVYGSSYLRMRLSGTTQSYVTLASLREMPLIIPDEIRLLEFRRIIKSIFSKSYANRQQVQTLTKTRDRLLPKLMSGKLRITES